MAIDPLTIELQLVPATRPDGALHVEGTARLAPATAHPLSGWMALLQLLESMVANASESPPA
ncbi:MAG: hypothetical protein ACT4PI_18015 [Actinomycetota bacterium]